MSKIAKITIILGLCLICAGLIISGGNIRNLILPFQEESGNVETYRTTQLPTTINIDNHNDNIKILPTEEDVITITYYEAANYEYKITNLNGILSFTTKRKSFFPIINFSFKVPDMVIEIPRELEIRYDVETTNGNILMKNLNSKYLNLDTTNGNIEINKITADGIKLESTNGDIKIYNAISPSINGETTNGSVKFDNIRSNSIEFSNTNGGIKGTLFGSAHNYWMDLKTTNGKIKINGEEFGNRKKDTSIKGNQIINAKTTNGSISIDFK